MNYFEAVTEGRKRVSSAVSALEAVAGPCHPMLFLKLGISDWTPVGEELLHQVIPGRNQTAAVVICDSDGNSKAMSAWVDPMRASEFSKALEREGILLYTGEVKLPI